MKLNLYHKLVDKSKIDILKNLNQFFLFLFSGVYQFCIDNSLSRFQDKLISLYCSSYKRDEWEKLVEGLQDSDSNLANITVLD